MVRSWGKIWYSIGIARNFAFFAIWLITRFPGNPITGGSRGGMRTTINSMEIITKIAQLAFIGITAAILILENRRRLRGTLKAEDVKQREEAKSSPSVTSTRVVQKIRLLVLALMGISLIITSTFVLPSLMPRPNGGGGPPALKQTGVGGGEVVALGRSIGVSGLPSQGQEQPAAINTTITTTVAPQAANSGLQ